MPIDPLRELVLPRLQGVVKSGGEFKARCPAHEDRHASLTVGVGHKQPVVLRCHAGCESDDIVVALGLTLADLSQPQEPDGSGEWTPAGPAVAVYDYVDEDGKLLFQVLRTASKDFRQRVPDPLAKSGWTWKLGDTRRVLYRLPKVIEAIEAGQEVWIVEGEKDVHSLEAVGVTATCNPGGAGKWRPDYSEVFRGASVTIAADRDAPGQAHARQVATALAGIADRVRIVEPAAGKDITDHLAAGHSHTEVGVTWVSEDPPELRLAVDLWEFITAEDVGYDWVVPYLLERGDRFILTGFEGLGKSTLARQLVVTTAAGLHPFTFEQITPRKVLFIDCENSERQSRRKFRKLAELSERYGRRVGDGMLRLIHRPAGIDLTREEDASWLLERVTVHKPDLLFIGPFYRLHNGSMNDEEPCRRVVGVLDYARVRAECALVIEAHSPHGEAGLRRSVRPVGSSLLLRWPEFGYGLAPANEDGSRVDFKRWRGPRDDREWPKRLERAGMDRWPWWAPIDGMGM